MFFSGYLFLFCFLAAHEIKLTLGHTVGEIMNTSRDVMVTKGEWELLDMTVYEHELDIGVAARHQITYYVSSLILHNLHTSIAACKNVFTQYTKCLSSIVYPLYYPWCAHVLSIVFMQYYPFLLVCL